MSMRPTFLMIAAASTLLVACATTSSTPNVRPPLAATLSSGAKTGAPVPLHFDPNARVIISRAAELPPASFLPSQAARGEKVFGETCALCHEPGTLVGQGFVENWSDRRVYDLYALVRSTMPLDRPGQMKETEYLDVIAYLLQANHAPAGTDSLKSDSASMRRTKIAVKSS
jgi:cytochrome c5